MRRAILAFGMVLGMAGATVQAEEGYPFDYEGWRFQVTPYVWATSLSVDVRPMAGVPTLSVSQSFSDILKDLDGAFFLNASLRKDRFVVLGDLTWAKVSQSAGVNLGEIPVVHWPITATVSGTVTQRSLTLAAGYSVIQEPQFVLDLFGGARGWHVKASVEGELDLGPFFLRRSATRTVSWIDPIVGARARVQLSPDWSVIGYADVGGFGAGSRSTWQVMGLVNYRVTDHFFLSAGYRHMSFDYRSNGTLLDIDMTGPVIGATIRF